MTYKDFDAWFWELEGFGTRGERFFEELKHMDEKRALEWLRACWMCARQDDMRDQFERECG